MDNYTIPDEDTITWADLGRLEPKLLELWSEVKDKLKKLYPVGETE